MASLSPLARQLIRDAQREPLPSREHCERAHARFERAIAASPTNAEFLLKKPLLRLLVLGALFLGASSSVPQSPQKGPASSSQLGFEAVRAAVPPPGAAASSAPDNAVEHPTRSPAFSDATPRLPALRASAPSASQAGVSRHSQPSADDDSLRRELAALEAARRSASAARYSEALQVLAGVEFRQLGLERDALQLWLRCKQSDASAVAAARSFLAHHADHPMFSRVREACLATTTRTIPTERDLPEKEKDVR